MIEKVQQLAALPELEMRGIVGRDGPSCISISCSAPFWNAVIGLLEALAAPQPPASYYYAKVGIP